MTFSYRSALVVAAWLTLSSSSAWAQDAQAPDTPKATTPDAQDEAPVVPGPLVNRPMLAVGLVVLGSTYVTSSIVGAESSLASDHKYLSVPVAGPWLDVTSRDCGPSTCGHEVLAKAALVTDGVFQVAGALAIYASFFVPERTTKKWLLFGGTTTIVPTAGRSGVGLSAAAIF